MTCEEALEKIYDVIDNEASEIDCQRVREHLDHCRDCTSRYEFEEKLRAFINRRSPDPERSDRLKKKILECIDCDDDSSLPRRRCSFRFCAVALSAAIALIICIISAFAVAKFYRHKVYIYPFERQHMQREANLLSGNPSFEEWISARDFLGNDLQLAVDVNTTGHELVRVGSDEILGGEFAHLRFIDNGVHISLFVGAAEGVKLPDFEPVVLSEMEYYKHVCGQCQMIYWISGNVITIAVTENKGFDLTTLFPVVRPI
ncbi:MAG: zf-HC2 domain-containing protein [Candidatus Zixiibacteriota bacterium]|nr:MAG: zf-HC2 domain-containing protein [candidate division Zixibacteria bacterium]